LAISHQGGVMPDREKIKRFRVYESLSLGAQNTVSKCLSVKETDLVTLVFDTLAMEAASAIIQEIELVGATYEAFVLESYGERPTMLLPTPIAESLRRANVSIYGVTPMCGEYDHRAEIFSIVKQARLRHAHMLSLSSHTLIVGMAADYGKIRALNEWIIGKLKRAEKVQIKSFTGTDVVVTPHTEYKLHNIAGIITEDHWHNLPNGEVVFHPRSISGTYVCDGHLPMSMADRTPGLERAPLELHFEDNVLARLEGGPPGVASQLNKKMETGQNLNRVGAVSIGTNYEIRSWTGNIVIDGYSPSAFLMLGYAGDLFELPWNTYATLHFIGRRTSLLVDDEPIITAGRFAESDLEKL